jgi:ribose transport system substrate-binding protein
MKAKGSWMLIAFVTIISMMVGQVVAPVTASAAGPEDADVLVRLLDPKALPEGWAVPKTVGHVVNYLMHEWYQNETKGEMARAADFGIDFSLNDANLDLQKSLAGVDDYLAKGVDAIVFTPVNEEASAPTIKKATEAGMPVVCEGSPTEGCLTLVSIDDYQAGFDVGVWAGEYAKANFGGKALVLDIGLPALSTTVARSNGFADGLKSVLPDAQIVQSVDGKGLKDEAVKVAADALTANPDVNIIFGINDDSALGGLQAFQAAGLDTANLLVVGFGCEGKACKSALMEGGPYKVSAGMFPEYQGRLLINAAVAAYNKLEMPKHIVAPTAPVTKDNLGTFYTQEGDEWLPNYTAIAMLSPVLQKYTDSTVRGLDPKALPKGWAVPKTVGHVVNYLMHEWYQNETKGEMARAADFGIEFSLNDANLDLQKSLAGVDDYLAKGVDAIVFTPVNEEASAPTIKKAVASGMPVVCEGSPTEGCLTLVSINDYEAGYKVGVWAGEYAKANFGGKALVLDIGLPALSTTVARSNGFADGLKSVLPDAQIVQSVDGKGLKDEAVKVAADALTANPDVNIIFGINDDSALGGLQAFQAAGLDTANLLVVGFGCEGKACKSALMEGGPYKVSAGMFPEYQGRLLINAAVAAFNGFPMPPHIVAPTTPVTKDNLGTFYTQEGDEWVPNFEATAAIK